MSPRISLLLGKPPRPETVLAEVADELRAGGAEIEVQLPHEHDLDPSSLREHDLVVHRGLHTTLTPLLAALDEQGTPLCPPFAADELLRDRRAWRSRLTAAGISLPPAREAGAWTEVRAAASEGVGTTEGGGEGTGEGAGTGEIVVKALAGPGRGSQVLAGTAATLPREAPFVGPYLLEPRLPAEDLDRKLYVAGRSVRAQLKPSTLTHSHVTSGEPFTSGPELVDLGLAAAAALGAHLCGVDVLETPGGPVVVDVNAFPGFRGIADAPALVAAHLREHAGSR